MINGELSLSIAKFYKVCLFGNKEDDYIAAASRAYRDLCRTIRFKNKEDKKGIEECRAIVEHLIAHEIKNCLPNANQEAYNKFHLELCDKIKEVYRDRHVAYTITYGQAQKWVNMTMKYLCVLSGGNFTGDYAWLAEFYQYLHVPIDGIILDEISEKFSNIKLNKDISWSKINDYNYYIYIQNKLRECINTKLPMDWEFEVWG